MSDETNGNVDKYRIGVLEDWIKKLDGDIENIIMKKLSTIQTKMALIESKLDQISKQKTDMKKMWMTVFSIIAGLIITNLWSVFGG